MDKVIEILKGVWGFVKDNKSHVIWVTIVITILGGAITGWVKYSIMKLAYENQETQSEKTEISHKNQINALTTNLTATKKTVKKYKVLANKECDCEPKKYEEVVYENLKETKTDSTKTETKTDTETKDKSNIKLPDAYKMWQIGGGYDIFTGGWYIRGAIETGTMLFIECQYPILFDGMNRLKVGVGLRF